MPHTTHTPTTAAELEAHLEVCTGSPCYTCYRAHLAGCTYVEVHGQVCPTCVEAQAALAAPVDATEAELWGAATRAAEQRDLLGTPESQLAYDRAYEAADSYQPPTPGEGDGDSEEEDEDPLRPCDGCQGRFPDSTLVVVGRAILCPTCKERAK